MTVMLVIGQGKRPFLLAEAIAVVCFGLPVQALPPWIQVVDLLVLYRHVPVSCSNLCMPNDTLALSSKLAMCRCAQLVTG